MYGYYIILELPTTPWQVPQVRHTVINHEGYSRDKSPGWQ